MELTADRFFRHFKCRRLPEDTLTVVPLRFLIPRVDSVLFSTPQETRSTSHNLGSDVTDCSSGFVQQGRLPTLLLLSRLAQLRES